MTIVIDGTPSAADSLPTILYTNYFATGTIDATSDAAGYDKENVGTESTYDSWKGVALPDWVYVDAGSSVACDAAAIVAHDCGTKGNTVLLAYSTDNVSWTEVDSVAPTDDSPILFLFGSISARYWRFRFTGGTDEPFIGVAMVGPRLTMPNGVVTPYTPMWASKQYEMLPSNSLGGQFLGNRIIRKSAETSVTFTSVTETFAEGDLRPFMEHYNQGKAFIFASGPAVFDLDVGYCWKTSGGQIRPTYDENGTWMSVSMDVQCYVE
jgi:hypothetical protein